MRLTTRLLALVPFGLGTFALPSHAGAVSNVVALSPALQVADSTFRHDRHADFACRDCHAMEPDHGALLIRSVSDCRSCHHVRERMDRACTACHEAADLRNVVYPMERVLTLSVRDGPDDREFRFSHAAHEERACAECHAEGPSLAVPNLDCQRCHGEHHVATNPGCMNCHREPRQGAHTLEVHRTCTASGCHTDGSIAAPPRTRVGCLWCHEDMTDHEPQGLCVDCHSMPGRSVFSSLRGGPIAIGSSRSGTRGRIEEIQRLLGAFSVPYLSPRAGPG